MAKNYYSYEETLLCTYAAMYDAQDFGGYQCISEIKGRSSGSIWMKIRNIAALLDEEGIKRSNNIKPLSGMPPGESGRKTSWDIVSFAVKLPKLELKLKCLMLLNQYQHVIKIN